VAILKLNHVLSFQLASKTSQPYAMIADVQRMGQMALLISACSSDPQSHWCNHFGSLLPPLAFDKSRHVEPAVGIVHPVAFFEVFVSAAAGNRPRHLDWRSR
jgi:hypothetical protein